MTILTNDEIADLTKVHAAAFDLVRTTAADNDERPPMWLCMSDDAKREAVERLRALLSEQAGRNLDTLGLMLLCGSLPDEMLERWRTMETMAKEQREAGNPRAFFA